MRRTLLLVSLLAVGCGSDALSPTDGGVDSSATPDLAPAADSAVTCAYGGASHALGTVFPSSDGCNTCMCLAGGAIACTEKACLDGGTPDGPAACDFTTSYSYGDIGGNAAYVERTDLSPANKYVHTRSSQRGTGPLLSCAPALPPCGAQDAISAYDLEVHDLPLPDVKAALAEASPPLYGYDSRPVDGTVFELKRADGRGFLVGQPCDNRTPCRPIPAGVAQLVKRLRDLDAQQLAKPECATFRP
jgi:hypothetical protein